MVVALSSDRSPLSCDPSFELKQVVLVHFVRDGSMLRIEHKHAEDVFHQVMTLDFADSHLSNAMELVDNIIASQKVEGMLFEISFVVVCPEYLHLFLVYCVFLPSLHHLVQ